VVVRQSKSPALSRRSALRLALIGVPALASAGALAGCQVPDRSGDPQARTLQSLISDARTDAAVAADLAGRLPARTADLKTVAEQRTAHAAALTDELSRYLERPAAATTSASAPPPPSGGLTALRSRLTASAKRAADAAVGSAGEPASLLGAVAAATATHAQVVLA
jgi:hypothetical protein